MIAFFAHFTLSKSELNNFQFLRKDNSARLFIKHNLFTQVFIYISFTIFCLTFQTYCLRYNFVADKIKYLFFKI